MAFTFLEPSGYQMRHWEGGGVLGWREGSGRGEGTVEEGKRGVGERKGEGRCQLRINRFAGEPLVEERR